ncbi:hypothetical protein AB0L53_56355 [Nonomuraea sp. NPDC052129]|uniref:hypothetical protein n=1 Tax=Nonomuraea sp. NPDC052129 TaxID=3154651 RepID=UPI00342A95E3
MSIPQTIVLAALAEGTTDYSIMITGGDCGGGMEEILFGPTAVLILIPQPIVVAVGFGLWALRWASTAASGASGASRSPGTYRTTKPTDDAGR